MLGDNSQNIFKTDERNKPPNLKIYEHPRQKKYTTEKNTIVRLLKTKDKRQTHNKSRNYITYYLQRTNSETES